MKMTLINCDQIYFVFLVISRFQIYNRQCAKPYYGSWKKLFTISTIGWSMSNNFNDLFNQKIVILIFETCVLASVLEISVIERCTPTYIDRYINNRHWVTKYSLSSSHLIEVVREMLAMRLDHDWAHVTGGSRHVAILRGARLKKISSEKQEICMP